MSTFVDATAGAVEYCETTSKALSEVSTSDASHFVEYYYQPIAEYCQQKLWHQLTLRVLELVHDRRAAMTVPGPTSPYLAIYDKVVLAVDKHLHPLSLARIAAAVAHKLSSHDMTAAKAVLENLLDEKKESLGVSATIYVQSQLSLLTLQTLPPGSTTTTADSSTNELSSIKTLIRTNEATLRELADQPALVHAAHYEQAMTYYKVVGPPEAFYEQAMRFLHYAPPPDRNERAGGFTNYHQLAIDLCLAALTGDGVYNLGQVVEEQAALLQLLLTDDNDGKYGWLVALVKATAAGHVHEFQQLTQQHEAAIALQPALVHRAAAVQEKLTLLALCDLVFHKPSHERHLSFAEIAEHLSCTADQVEWIIMRALSVHLIEGSMDQVDQVFHVTWIVPRVLTAAQLQGLAGRYGEWAGKVSRTKDVVQEQTATFA